MAYKTAITRKPGLHFSDGITTSGLGKPDLQKALDQHAAYVETLRSFDIEVIVLNADETFPDGCFVEDTAVVFPEAAIITNPGAASRKGEIHVVAEVLKKYRKLYFIETPGTIEGGDVLRIEKDFFIGLSERTNEEGVRQFSKIASEFGYAAHAIPLKEILHLKTGIAYIGNETIVGWKQLIQEEAFSAHKKIIISPEEAYASNCIFIDANKLIIPKGYPAIKSKLLGLNYQLTELNMSEFEKMDGGLTCLSLLIS